MVDPHIAGCLNTNPISICGEHVLANNVADNNILLLPDVKPNPHKFYQRVRSAVSGSVLNHILAPGSPIMDLLDPILTWTEPVMVPEITIILGVTSSFLALFAAAVNCARVETVVTVPPLPPVVLKEVLEGSTAPAKRRRQTVRLTPRFE
jgi:hypothetical protein